MFRLTTQIVVLLATVNAGLVRADEVTSRLGKWRCMAAESEEVVDATEEGDIWTVADKTIRARRRSGTTQIADYVIDGTKSPMEIDWTSTDENGIKWIGKGIAKCDGPSMQICAQVVPDGETAVRPKKFATNKGDQLTRMLLFSKVKD